MIRTLIDYEGKVSISVYKNFKNKDDAEKNNIMKHDITEENPSIVVVELFAKWDLLMNQLTISNLSDLKMGQKILKFDGFNFICFA